MWRNVLQNSDANRQQAQKAQGLPAVYSSAVEILVLRAEVDSKDKCAKS